MGFFINKIRDLKEATELEKEQLKKIKYNDATVDTPFIEDILKDVAKLNNTTLDKIKEKVQSKVNEIKSKIKNPNGVDDVRLKGLVESVVFQMLPNPEKNDEVFKDYTFNYKTLNDLFTYIEATYAQYFPLKDSFGLVKSPTIYITPSVFEQPDWMKGIDTAATSPEADIVFNKNFAKQLMYYADKKSLKGNAKYYQSQGGEIPDNYIYIEFLIRHEMGHILRSTSDLTAPAIARYIEENKDKYTKLLSYYNGNYLALAHQISNLSDDYVMNFQLMMNGLPQLPVGLFSDKYNYMNYNTIREIYKDILDNMEAETPEYQEQLNQTQTDQHLDQKHETTNGENGQSGQQGQNGQDSQSGQDGQSGQSGQNSKNSQSGQQGQNGQDSQSGQNGQDSQGGQNGQNGQDSQMSNEDMKRIFDKIDKGNKRANDITNTAMKNSSANPEEMKSKLDQKRKELEKISKERISQQLKDMKKLGSGNAFDADYTPHFDWKKIIKKMINTKKGKEETYSKVSRRNSAGLLRLKQVGITAAKPGVTQIPANKKNILFVIDNSGSTMSVIGKVNKEIQNLLVKHKKMINDFYVIKFDTQYTFYKVDENYLCQAYTKSDIANLLKGSLTKPTSSKKISLKQLLSANGFGGGTSFSSELTKIIDKITKKMDINTVVFSDTDITSNENADNIMYLIAKYGKKPFKFNVIMATEQDMNQFVTKIKAFKYLTHF